MSNYKFVTAPLSINDMDNDLESKCIYIFNYDNSKIKNIAFLNYIKNLGVIADIHFDNASYDEKSSILLEYMKSIFFYHILSLNITILNCLYFYHHKNIFIPNGILNLDEIKKFTNDNKNIFNIWSQIYNSIFGYMLNIISYNTKNNEPINSNKIKSIYYPNNINTDSCLYPNIMSLLLDDVFYDYFLNVKIKPSDFQYYENYFSSPIYDEKSLYILLLNDGNFIFKILYDTLHNEEFRKFLLKQI